MGRSRRVSVAGLRDQLTLQRMRVVAVWVVVGQGLLRILSAISLFRIYYLCGVGIPRRDRERMVARWQGGEPGLFLVIAVKRIEAAKTRIAGRNGRL